MSGFANDIANAIGQLVRTKLTSDNYVAGVSGWAIFRDGTAEFNEGTFRSSVQIGPDAGPDLFIGPAVPALVSNFYSVNYLGSVGDFIVLMKVDANNYYYQVLLTSSALGPAIGRGWVIAGVLMEEYFSYFDGTQLVVEFAGDAGTQPMEFFIGKVKLIVGTGDPTDTYPDLIFGNTSLPRGLVLFERITSNHATTAATTEQTIYTTSQAYDFPTGRAYLVEVVGQINSGTAPIRTRVRVRKGVGTGGTILHAGALSIIDTASTDCPINIPNVFVNTSGANVNTKLTITFQNTAAAVVNYDGSAAPTNTYIRVVDVGAANFYTGVSL